MRIRRIRTHSKSLGTLALVFVVAALCPPRPLAAPPTGPSYIAGHPDPRQFVFRYEIERRALGRAGSDAGVYGRFSQTSFWYLDEQGLDYRVETHFAPGVRAYADGAAMRRLISSWPGDWGVTFGYSHHSNGWSGALSRRWNRMELGLHRGHDRAGGFRTTIEAWMPFNREETNADIARYAGHGRILAGWRHRAASERPGAMDLWASTRYSLDGYDGRVLTCFEAGFSYAPDWLARTPGPRSGPGLAIFLHWFVGRGESMIDYRSHSNKIRVGLRII